MIAARLAKRGDGDGDAGIGMVELIVSMMITTIALAIIGSLFVTVATATTNSNATRTATGTAANAMDEMSRVIRSASAIAASSTTSTPAIVAGTATSVTLIAYVDSDPTNPAPVQVTFTVDSTGTLVETRIAGVSTGGFWVFSGAVTTRTLAQNLVAGSPLFSYYDAADSTATGTAMTLGTTGLTASQCALVATIGITVTAANTQTNGSDPVVLQTMVGMPNLDLTGSGT